MNNKLIALFLIFVIISITPASAVEYADIQNDMDSLRYSQQHFGFWQCFKVMGKVFTLMKHALQINIFPMMERSKGVREGLKRENKNIQLERTTLLKYLSDKDRIEKTNQINELNTKKSNQDFKQINKIKSRINETKQINGSDNSTNDFNQVNGTQNSTMKSNNIQNIANNTQINNTAKVKADMVEAPEKAVSNVKDMKSKLSVKGLNVKIRYSVGSIDELKPNDIVQLIETSHGYIRYWIFNGINNNLTDNKAVSLYNGKTNVNLSLRIFKRAFTGIVMNLDGDYKVKIVNNIWGQRKKIYTLINEKNSLKDTGYVNLNLNKGYLNESGSTSNKLREEKTENELTEYDVLDEIYQIQKKTLEDSINKSERMKTIAGLLKGIKMVVFVSPNYWRFSRCFCCFARTVNIQNLLLLLLLLSLQ